MLRTARQQPSRVSPVRRRGFSIIELLVAVIIIGILAAILIPIVGNRSEQARIARAVSDLERIGDALERAAVDTGYYPRIWMLNYTQGSNTQNPGPFVRNPGTTIFDTNKGVRDIGPGGYFEGIPQRVFILPQTGEFVDPSTQILDRLQNNETEFNWNGPYMNWQQDNNFRDGFLAPDGMPDDPWGNNYLFFTRRGMVLEPQGEIVQSHTFDGMPGPTGQLDRFGRAVVLSLGPNGVPGNGNAGALVGEGDDIVRQFGY